MVKRLSWSERQHRPGWDIQYTIIGGRMRSAPNDRKRNEKDVPGLPRFVAQAFLACPKTDVVASDDIRYWATICRRILQRGGTPPIPTRAETALRESIGELDTSSALEGVDATAVLCEGPSSWQLEPSIELHPTYERPFWDLVAARYPELLRWLTPQAPLEALAGIQGQTRRWVDFLIFAPWQSHPYVLEIDGQAHESQSGVDKERDGLLRTQNVEVLRANGEAALDPTGPFFTLLGKIAAECPSSGPLESATLARRRLILGPAEIQRFAFAVVEGVARGLLAPTIPWRIALVDPSGAVEQCAGPILDTLAAVGDLWDVPVVPSEIQVGGTLWRRVGAKFNSVEMGLECHTPALEIILDPGTPAHAALPERSHPTIVVRHTLLPVYLTWAEPSLVERRSISAERNVEAPLRVLAQDIFGIPDFRDGQLPAIRRVLAGKDVIVTLPTGGGKSLIYQLTALLRPGLAIVVDPLVSLIDDQVRRLRELGVDRVIGLHAAVTKRTDARELYDAVTGGEALFVFLTPERLQIKAFRQKLAAAAQEQMVNLAVIDEVHCVSEWGHDFRTSYLRLARNLRDLCVGRDKGLPPILSLTGTASPAVLRDVLRDLGMNPNSSDAVQRPASYQRPNLHYNVIAGTPDMRLGNLEKVLLERLPLALGTDAAGLCTPGSGGAVSGLIFVPHVNKGYGLFETRQSVNDALTRAGGQPKIEIYSGSRPTLFEGINFDEYKRGAAARFIRGDTPLLVSTKAFGMGIDKPDIRFTLHVGIPSSIEAFAQEAGRAGRDGKHSECILLASIPSVDSARRLLDPTAKGQDRHRFGRDGDLAHQLYFLYKSFPNPEEEFKICCAVLDELTVHPNGVREVAIPRTPSGAAMPDGRKPEVLREKALYRLCLIGVVRDYTVEYGADTFQVLLADYNLDSIDRALLEQAQRIDPGREAANRQDLEQAPADLKGRVRHHIKKLVGMIYKNIWPARLRALEDVYRLTLGNRQSSDISRVIASYLGEGPLATILPALIAEAAEIDVKQVIDALKRVPTLDEWEGATARQLEDTPEHPVALFAAALAQAWKPNGDPERFRDLLEACFEQ
ncbi:MAG: ATP-dependent DNA helicase RecQ, partial [Gammaproteobacteria bacterium]|nr:ATP-dependent DNA helicase RecQ [Gammaproteobacteria bacterium]